MEHNLDLGQHFLTNNKIIETMINSACLKNSESVLEIGAGDGILTKELAKKCKEVTVVEIDERLKQFLEPIEKEFANVKVTYANALNIDFTQHKKIVTSLPYNIIEPFIHKCVKEKVNFVLMLIGDKYALSLTNEKKHNYLQTLTQTYFNTELIEFVGKENFNPQPRTGSYVVRLTRKTEFNDLEFLLNELFSQTDKKIKNALIESIIRLKKQHSIICTQKQAKSLVESLNLSEKITNSQMSNLNNEEFNELYLALKAHIENFC